MGQSCSVPSIVFNRKKKKQSSFMSSSISSNDLTIEPSKVTKFLKKQNHDNDLQLLLPRTHFNPVEFKLLKQYFASLCSDPEHLYLKESQCKDLFFSPNQHHVKQKNGGDESIQQKQPADSEFVLHAVFKAVNTDNDGLISFSEFAQAISVAIHGNFYEKAKLAFRIYDSDGDGTVTYQDFRDYMNSLRRLGILNFCVNKEEKKITRGDEELEQLDVMMSRQNSESNKMEISAETLNDEEPSIEVVIDSQSSNSSVSMGETEQVIIEPEVPSEDAIHRILQILFSESKEITFQDFLLQAANEKYLVEGAGIYDYIFLPLYNPIQEFLSSESPYEKNGLLKYKNKLYHVEIRGGIIYHYDEEKKTCKKMINIEKLNKVRFQKPTIFEVKKGRNWRRYESISNESVQHWIFCILLFMISRKDNRYNSFAPVRRHSAVGHLVDGKETFAAMAHAMLNAKEQIFIAGWCVSPYIYLKRDKDLNNPNQYRLDNILTKMANNGVQIYIIMWHETTLAGMNLSSAKIQRILNGMHPNIHCIMHPRGVPFHWTHHQKCVIVDQVVAFCGGLDMAWGRYDTSSHPITDNCYYSMTYPGNDYYNGTVTGFVRIAMKIDGFRDGLDRDRHPRMPWHDVHCVAIGKLAKDFSSNFISRWNHHNGLSLEKIATSSSTGISANNDTETEPFVSYSSVLELSPFDPEKASKAHVYLPSNLNMYHIRGQVLRSIGTWSGSMRTEQSIHAAYIETIKRSQFYIYIENQYFCSHTPKSMEIENLIAQALIERISRAILNEETFRVYVVLPMHPDGDPFDSSIQQVIKWQRRTIEGIFETLKANFPEANIDNYIAFFCLANYGFLQNMAHFNQVYVHSKLLLVDDKVTIIGSSNINDRSMVGSHDSEIALIIEDTDSSQTMMNNKLRRVGKFGKSLRKRLWREHLGLEGVVQHGSTSQDSLQNESNKQSSTSQSASTSQSRTHPASRMPMPMHLTETNLAQRIWNQPMTIAIKDPISDYTFNHIWRKRARENTKIYESVFVHFPGDRFHTVAEWKKAVDGFNYQVDNMPYQERETLYRTHQKTLKTIKGQVVDYPLTWLKKDAHKKDIRLQVLDDNIFY